MQQHLPQTSASLLGKARWALSGAAEEVRKGNLLDHSKQKQLRESLLQMTTMFPGSKILILGDSRAFFAVYSIVVAANLRAFQLDRAGDLKEAQALASAVETAMEDADCLLLSYEQLCLPGFPIQLFRCAIEYARQAALDQQSTLAASELFKQRARLYWVAYIMPEEGAGIRTIPSAGRQEEAPHSAKAISISNGVETKGGLKANHQWYEQASTTTASAATDLPLPAEGNPLPAEGLPLLNHDEQEVSGSLAGTVVLSSRSEGAIQSSRQLYEAVLQLESEGLTVVEQQMDTADIALSMSTCICLYTDNSQGDLLPAAYINLHASLVEICLKLSCEYEVCWCLICGSDEFINLVESSRLELARAAKDGSIMLRVLTGKSCSMQDMVVAAVRSFAGNPTGHTEEALPSEPGSALELVLNKFSAANPFSAAALASKGWTPRRLADLGQSQANILTQEIAGLTSKSAALLIAQAKTTYEVLSKRVHGQVRDAPEEVYAYRGAEIQPQQDFGAEAVGPSAQDMEAMEGDMTWNWNSGQQMNPHFLAQHLQSQQPHTNPRSHPHQPDGPNQKDCYEEAFAAIDSNPLEVQDWLGDSRLGDRRDVYPDTEGTWQPAHEPQGPAFFSQQELYGPPGEKLQELTSPLQALWDEIESDSHQEVTPEKQRRGRNGGLRLPQDHLLHIAAGKSQQNNASEIEEADFITAPKFGSRALHGFWESMLRDQDRTAIFDPNTGVRAKSKPGKGTVHKRRESEYPAYDQSRGLRIMELEGLYQPDSSFRESDYSMEQQHQPWRPGTFEEISMDELLHEDFSPTDIQTAAFDPASYHMEQIALPPPVSEAMPRKSSKLRRKRKMTAGLERKKKR